MRYRLKLGDAFADQKYQICVIGESAAKVCGPQLQVSNMRYLLKFGDALQPKSTKYALSVKVHAAKFCGP